MTFYQMILNAIFISHTFQECALTGRKYSHKEIFKKSHSFAASLKQQGLHRRDVVCILLPNIPEYPIVALGIWEAGLIVSPIDPSYTPGKVRFTFKVGIQYISINIVSV